jgi:hypothetical protein
MLQAISRGSRVNTPKVSTMATANQRSESRISSSALSVLDCFVSEFDDVILSVAEVMARQRLKKSGQASEPVRVEAEDVRDAVACLLEAVRSREGQDTEVVQAFEGMYECLRTKCDDPRTATSTR